MRLTLCKKGFTPKIKMATQLCISGKAGNTGKTDTHTREVLTISSLLKHTHPPSRALLKSKLTATPSLILTVAHKSQIPSSSSVPQINNYGCCLPMQKVVGSTCKTNTHKQCFNLQSLLIYPCNKVNAIKPGKVRHDVRHQILNANFPWSSKKTVSPML